MQDCVHQLTQNGEGNDPEHVEELWQNLNAEYQVLDTIHQTIPGALGSFHEVQLNLNHTEFDELDDDGLANVCPATHVELDMLLDDVI